MAQFSLRELAARAQISTAPALTEVLGKAKDLNPDLLLLDSESQAELKYWFERYHAQAETQLRNLKDTITQPVKVLALDLVLLDKADKLKKLGITINFSKFLSKPDSQG